MRLFIRRHLLTVLLSLCLLLSAAYNLHALQASQTQARNSQNVFLSNFESVSNAADVSLRNLQQNRDIDVEKQLYALTSALSSMEATLYYGADAVGSELLDGRKGVDFGSIAALLRGMGETRGSLSIQTEPFDADGRISEKELLFLHRLHQDVTALREIAQEHTADGNAYPRFVEALDALWLAWSLDNPDSPCLAFAASPNAS